MFQGLKFWRHCRKLRSKDENVRCAAIDAVAKLKDPRAVDLFIKALGDSAHSVRLHAARAVGAPRETRAVEPLLTLLTDRCEEVRSQAAELLGQLADPRALGPLRELLGDPNGKVRRAAAKSLQLLGEPRWEAVIKGDSADWWRWWQVGDSGDDRAIWALSRAICEDTTWHDICTELRARKNPRLVEALLRMLQESDERVLARAAAALGISGDKRAVEPLIQIIAYVSLNSQFAAAEAAGLRWDDTRGRFELGKTLRRDAGATHRSPEVMAAAAVALGELGDRRSVDALMNLLEHHERRVRRSAASALGKLGDARAVDALIRTLEDREESVRSGVIEALAELGDARVVQPLIKKLGSCDVHLALLALARLDWSKTGGREAAVAPMIELLNGDALTAQTAALALGRIGGPEVLAPLGSLGLHHPDMEVRIAAVDALVATGDAGAVKPLVRCIDTWMKTSKVRADLTNAVIALGKLGNARAVPTLLQYGTLKLPSPHSAFYYAEQCSYVLTAILRTEAREVAIKDLRSITQLKDEEWDFFAKFHVDYAEARALASCELERRDQLDSGKSR